MARQSAQSAPRLEREKIVEVALSMLDRFGFEQLSLRRVADELGVQTPALYWHIKDRAELYGLMAQAMLRDTLEQVPRDLTGSEFLVALGRSLHSVHMSRRDAPKLIALSSPTVDGVSELREVIEERVSAGGIRPAAEAVAAVYAFTLGWSLFRTNAAIDAAMARRMDVERAFEIGLAALSQGFRP